MDGRPDLSLPSLPHWLSPLSAGLRRWGHGPALLLALALVMALWLPLCVSLAVMTGLWFETTDIVVLALVAVLLMLPLLLLGHALLTCLRRLTPGMSLAAGDDPLSGVLNRAQVLDLMARDFASASRYDMECALLLVDVDHFKNITGAFGSRCGDALLRAIADASHLTLRQSDLDGRFGDDEFIVFLPHTDPLGALDVAERMRRSVDQLQFDGQGTRVLARISISIGVAARCGPSTVVLIC